VATIQQLEEGIRRADAAGDTEGVRVLGQQLMTMRQQQASYGGGGNGKPLRVNIYGDEPPLSKVPVIGGFLSSLAGPTTGTTSQRRMELGLPPVPDKSFGDRVTRSATFGQSDRALGVTAAIMNALKAPFSDRVKFDPGRAYNVEVDDERAAMQHYADTHPGASLGADLLGGLVGIRGELPTIYKAEPGKTLPLGKRVTNNAALGGGFGFLQGVGNGNGVKDSVQNGLLSAMAGSVLGPIAGEIIPPAVSAVGSGVKTIADGSKGAINLLSSMMGHGPVFNQAVAPTSGRAAKIATKLITNAMSSDNVVPREAGAAMDAAHANGVPAMLADQGENLQRLLGSAARQPGQARTLARSALRDRQMGSYDRVLSAINRDLGPVANVNQQSQAITEGARQAAAPLYKEAYAAAPIASPELDQILSTPTAQSAVARARTIAANERRDPSSLGFAIDENGNVVLNPSNVSLHGDQAQARATRDAIANQLAETQRRADASLTPAQYRDQISSLSSQLERANAALGGADAALTGAPTADVAATQRSYSPQTLDYVKRGIDDQLEPYRNQFTGDLDLDEMGSSINKVRRDFLSQLDQLNPAYAAARAAYAGPAAERTALLRGSTALGKSSGDLDIMTANLSPSEREQFALGMRAALADKLGKQVDGGDKVGAILGSPQRRAALQRAGGENANFDRFAQTMDAERAAGDTYRTALTGSPTAVNLSDDALLGDAGIMSLDTLGRAIRGAKTGGFWGGITNALAPLAESARFGFGQTGDKVRQNLATLLTETDPAAFAQTLAGLQDLQRRAILRGQDVSRLGNIGAARVGGTIGGYVAPPQYQGQ